MSTHEARETRECRLCILVVSSRVLIVMNRRCQDTFENGLARFPVGRHGWDVYPYTKQRIHPQHHIRCMNPVVVRVVTGVAVLDGAQVGIHDRVVDVQITQHIVLAEDVVAHS